MARTMYNHSTIEVLQKSLSSRLYHDICQQLSAIHFKIQELEPGATINELKRMVQNTQKEVAKISYQIAPDILFDFGLEAALRSYIHSFDPQIKFDFFKSPKTKDLNENTGILFFRAVLELLKIPKTNVEKCQKQLVVNHTSYSISFILSIKTSVQKHDKKYNISDDNEHIKTAKQIVEHAGGNLIISGQHSAFIEIHGKLPVNFQ